MAKENKLEIVVSDECYDFLRAEADVDGGTVEEVAVTLLEDMADDSSQAGKDTELE